MKGQTENARQYKKGYYRGYKAGLQTAINILRYVLSNPRDNDAAKMAKAREINKVCFDGGIGEGQTDSAQDQRGKG